MIFATLPIFLPTLDIPLWHRSGENIWTLQHTVVSFIMVHRSRTYILLLHSSVFIEVARKWKATSRLLDGLPGLYATVLKTCLIRCNKFDNRFDGTICGIFLLNTVRPGAGPTHGYRPRLSCRFGASQGGVEQPASVASGEQTSRELDLGFLEPPKLLDYTLYSQTPFDEHSRHRQTT